MSCAPQTTKVGYNTRLLAMILSLIGIKKFINELKESKYASAIR